MITDPREENRWTYLVYQCAPSSEVRGRRNGFEGGCLNWSIKKTKLDTETWRQPVQANCRWYGCNRRPRIHSHTVVRFDDKEMAKEYMNMKNNEQWQSHIPLGELEGEEV
jgi:hypothetical protein